MRRSRKTTCLPMSRFLFRKRQTKRNRHIEKFRSSAIKNLREPNPMGRGHPSMRNNQSKQAYLKQRWHKPRLRSNSRRNPHRKNFLRKPLLRKKKILSPLHSKKRKHRARSVLQKALPRRMLSFPMGRQRTLLPTGTAPLKIFGRNMKRISQSCPNPKRCPGAWPMERSQKPY